MRFGDSIFPHNSADLERLLRMMRSSGMRLDAENRLVRGKRRTNPVRIHVVVDLMEQMSRYKNLDPAYESLQLFEDMLSDAAEGPT